MTVDATGLLHFYTAFEGANNMVSPMLLGAG